MRLVRERFDGLSGHPTPAAQGRACPERAGEALADVARQPRVVVAHQVLLQPQVRLRGAVGDVVHETLDDLATIHELPGVGTGHEHEPDDDHRTDEDGDERTVGQEAGWCHATPHGGDERWLAESPAAPRRGWEWPPVTYDLGARPGRLDHKEL